MSYDPDEAMDAAGRAGHVEPASAAQADELATADGELVDRLPRPYDDPMPGSADYAAAEDAAQAAIEAGPEDTTTDLLLWLDFETAGPGLPDADKDTILEAAWTITLRYAQPRMRYGATDPSTWQFTPLRSRLTCLGVPDGRRQPTGLAPQVIKYFPEPGGHDDPDGWPHGTGEVQRKMHRASGLTTALVDAEHDGRVLHHAVELQRLILDDLDAARDAVSGDVRFYLAGHGVAQYDRALVRRELPRVAAGLHYRPIDVSVALQTLSDIQDGPSTHLMGMDDRVRRDWVDVVKRMTLDPRAQLAGTGSIRTWLDPRTVDPHRAAPDVARAVLTYFVARERIGSALSRHRDY